MPARQINIKKYVNAVQGDNRRTAVIVYIIIISENALFVKCFLQYAAAHENSHICCCAYMAVRFYHSGSLSRTPRRSFCIAVASLTVTPSPLFEQSAFKRPADVI